MQSNESIFEYLKLKIPNFSKTKKSNAHLFTCPNIKNHKYAGTSPTATFISGSDKISCLQCGFKGTVLDVVRVLEPEKKGNSDSDIIAYLIGILDADKYEDLKIYEQYGWSLVALAKNTRDPFEKEWRKLEKKDRTQWIKWLSNGLNIGANCELSNIMVVDVDVKKEPTPEAKELREEIIRLCEETNTLTQDTTSGGKHYVFQWEEDLRHQVVNGKGTQIDTRTEGQIAIAPSTRDGKIYKWVNLGKEIKKLPEELKNKLLTFITEKGTVSTNLSVENLKIEPLKLKNNNLDGCCNDTFVRLGGALIERLNPEQTKFVLHLLNKNILEQPMPAQSIDAMMGSLAGYKETEENSQEKMLYAYLTQMQRIHTKDAVESLKLSRAICDKYLSKFVLEGRAIRLARGYYQYREKVKWSDSLPEIMNKLTYKIPYFDFLQDFEEGDIIVLGGQPGHGKTTTSVNILKQVVEQGVKPYYIFSESGSRHYKIAKKLGLTDGEKLKFFATYHGNPLSIEIEPHSFTIIDWLMIGEKETTDMVFKHFTEEMERKGGVLIIMSQLKKTYDWYAPNMIDQFPALAARWILDSEDRTAGHWQVDKVRDCRLGVFNNVIPCDFNMETKILTAKEIV